MIRIVILGLFSIVVVGITVFFLLNSGKYERFENFKKDTEVIEGKVTDVKKENNIIFTDLYYLVVTTKEGSSKLIEVKEKQFKNNQKGSHVKFRYYTDEDLENRVAIDLTKNKDVQSDKELKSYYQKDKIIVW
ncbi:hypothetical protein [Mammaliicoccus sciuri]|uniref:hypothetical protein n=1 Tax=Mammaliicoccus sciuri TaxID=1296 RepID=UPI00288A10B8|nr:hypothetical protein [Mammaliicoccus sciuri]